MPRTRQQIEGDFEEVWYDNGDKNSTGIPDSRLILEAILDIRDALSAKEEQEDCRYVTTLESGYSSVCGRKKPCLKHSHKGFVANEFPIYPPSKKDLLIQEMEENLQKVTDLVEKYDIDEDIATMKMLQKYLPKIKELN